MAIRNFWIECEIDGRKTTLTGGPQAKDGGFYLTIKMRDNGGITTPLEISGFTTDLGLTLRISNKRTHDSFAIHTKR